MLNSLLNIGFRARGLGNLVSLMATIYYLCDLMSFFKYPCYKRDPKLSVFIQLNLTMIITRYVFSIQRKGTENYVQNLV